ncbi:MAG: MATE family efflux transporter [Oscillospiraceae bacterium]
MADMTDMTCGEPSALLRRFTLPMLGSVIFQQLYNITDSVVAGKFAGVDALAAVGASYPITMIFMAIATGYNIGVSVIISRLFGARDIKALRSSVSTAFIAMFTGVAVLTPVGLFTASLMLRALGTPENIMKDAAVYLNIYIMGLIFLCLYNICTGIFTALGDSKTPLYFLIGSSLANIGMDILFVAAFNMGVSGVAWATFICQGAASLLAAISLAKRMRTLKCEEKYSRFSKKQLQNIMYIAIPSILQQSFISVGGLFIQRLVNGFGSDVVAGYAAAVKLNTFAINGFSTLGNSLSAFTSQNIGAKQVKRVEKGFRAGIGMALLIALPFVLIYFFAGNAMMNIFMDKTAGAGAMAVGMEFLKIVSPFYLLICVKLMADGVLRGSGAMRPFMIATFADLILRVILAFILANTNLGATGIWLSWPLGWIIATGITVVFYKRGSWKPKE